MNALRIQHLQWFGGLAIAVGCLLLGAMSLVANLSDYRDLQAGSVAFRRFQAAMDAANAISAERGPANAAMGPARAEAPALVAALQARRVEVDRRLDAFEALFADEMREDDDISHRALLTRQSLAQARAVVDAVIAMPVEKRDNERVVAAIEAMFLAADNATRLRDRIGQGIVQSTRQLGAQILLSTMASELREHAGRVGSYVVMMLKAPENTRPIFRARAHETASRVRELGTTLADFAPAYFADPRIVDEIAALRREYFETELPRALGIAEARDPAQALTAATFTAQYVPGLAASERLRALIVTDSLRHLDAARAAAGRNIALTAALTAAVVAILAALSVAFRWGLFVPLIRAREQIVAIARDELFEPAPARHTSREIKEMFDGLGVLREHQRRRIELEDDQRRMAAEMKALSETDMLTGLYNRRALVTAGTEIMQRADVEGRQHAVVIFDIDHFKVVNDTYGHAVGDLVLSWVAATLRPLLRPGDIFARYGGEEFVILMFDADEDTALVLCERLREHLARTQISRDLRFTVTASFGLAVRRPGSGASWNQLVAVADKRLYRAKSDGRNQVSARSRSQLLPPPSARAKDVA